MVAYWALFDLEARKSLRRKLDRVGSIKTPRGDFMPVSTHLSYMA